MSSFRKIISDYVGPLSPSNEELDPNCPHNMLHIYGTEINYGVTCVQCKGVMPLHHALNMILHRLERLETGSLESAAQTSDV